MAQMRSRREQVEAHRFITSRMNQALVLANPDSIERPLRRIGVSIFASVMVMVVIFGGFAVATLFGKGNDAPLFNHIIQVKGSSAIYVYTTADGKEPNEDNEAKLWPVTNFTSALLLLQPYDGDPPVQSLKATSLKDIPRGFMVGIDNVPAQPPTAEELLQDQDWNACSMPREDGSVRTHQLTQLVITDMEEPTFWLGDDKWVLITPAIDVPEGEQEIYYLLWNDRSYLIDDPEVLSALGLTEGQAIAVNENVINTILPGSPLEVDLPEYFTQNSAQGVQAEDGTPVPYGWPLEISGSFYVLLQTEDEGDELSTITETQEALLEAEYGSPLTVSPTALTEFGAQASYGHPNFPKAVLSDTVWEPEGGRPALCTVYDPVDPQDGETEINVALYDTAPDLLVDEARSVEFTKEGEIHSSVDGLTAQTVLPPGRAVLADSRTNSGATVQSNTYLVDSLGFQFGLVDEGETDATQNLLGYKGVDSISVPDTMIQMIPKGADLSPYEARKQLVMDDSKVQRYETEAPAEGEGG
ncbi:type VII secretion protein EccB [Glycomyces paridis]|uniref:Type VII secretion protein EccB n=1 Tax=Glycomyces paridis TaxID=2126555 RepID=A0A4S8NWP4_9ACTN|nr:type VII secretion protein EccB [Glycomyces paridis]THV22050.1 type VII secretion protein EccB [Glycomyces paridis]